MNNRMRGKHWIGFDLGGTKMMAGLFSPAFKLLATVRRRTKPELGQRASIDRMKDLIHEVLEEAGIPRSRVGGIGVGFPGPLDLDKGIILQAPNLGWRNVPLRKELEREFKCRVVLANDVDAGTYGEYRFGAARGARCVVGVFPGTGIGGACIYEGRLIRGRNRSCMEIGHMKIQSNGRLCGCGRRGCLEAVASRLAVATEVAAAASRGEAPHIARSAGADLARMRSNTLAEAVRQGDEVVASIVRQAADFIGVAVANLVNLLCPDVVVLGGGLVEAMPKLIVEGCTEAARREVMDSFRSSFRVVPARLGDHAVVYGSAAFAATPEAVRTHKDFA